MVSSEIYTARRRTVVDDFSAFRESGQVESLLLTIPGQISSQEGGKD